MVNDHYGTKGLLEKIKNGLVKAGKDIDKLVVDDLAPVDEFHTRGRESTLELAQIARITADDTVLDVGCGLGGTARHLASEYNCKVIGIDLTDEYIDVGQQLTDLVNLSSKVKLQQGSALELPFEDETFDIVWTEHVQMNISDKEKFYSEISRVLKPGGKFLFHDIFRGPRDRSPIYPAPWAESESISFLATEDEARALIHNTGMNLKEWAQKVQESVEFFRKVSDKIEATGIPPIGIHLLMGENASQKLQNYVQNMNEQRLTVALGMATK